MNEVARVYLGPEVNEPGGNYEEAETVLKGLEKARSSSRNNLGMRSREMNKPMYFSFEHEGRRRKLWAKPKAFGAMDPMDRLLYAIGYGRTFTRGAEQINSFAETILDKGVKEEDLLSSEDKQNLILVAKEQGYLTTDDAGSLQLATRAAEVFDKERKGTGWRNS